VSFSSVDANTAAYELYKFEPGAPMNDYAIDSVMASASMPAVFPYVIREGKTLIDGGSVWNTDLVSAVEMCRATGAADNEITVDVVLCSGANIETLPNVENKNTFGHLMRFLAINSYVSSLADVTTVTSAFPGVTLRHFIAPSKALPSGMIPLDFNADAIAEMIATGKADAKNALSMASGELFALHKEAMDRKAAGDLKVDIDQLIEAKLASKKN